jgi:hypothetical protein
LPNGETSAKQLPYFVSHWQVETGHGTLSGATPFYRERAFEGPTMPCGAVASASCLSGYTG